jgi:hypothetical protein
MQVIEACDMQMARDKAAEDFFNQYTDGSEDELYSPILDLTTKSDTTSEKFAHELMKSADLSY